MKSYINEQYGIELYCGDCLNVLKDYVANKKHFDFIFTSPPYNRKRNDKYNNYDDSLSDYYKFLKDFLDLSIDIGEYVFLNIQKTIYNKKDVFKLIGDYGSHIVDIIIWGKTNPMPASGLSLTNAYEFIIIMSKSKTKIKCNDTYTKNILMTNVNSGNKYSKIHRATMNIDVSDWFVKTFVNHNETVLDPFMGVCTTGISCINKCANFTGVEINNEYFNVSVDRVKDCIEEKQKMTRPIIIRCHATGDC